MRKRSFALAFLVLGAALAWGQAGERETFAEAEERFAKGSFDIALDRYDAFLAAFPSSGYSADARFRRAVSLYKLGRPEEAQEAFGLVESRYPSTSMIPAVPYWKGLISFDSGEYAKAEALLLTYLKKPMDKDTERNALFLVGQAREALGRHEEAKTAFSELLVKARSLSSESDVLLALLSLCLRDGDYALILELSKRTETTAFPVLVADYLKYYKAEALQGSGDQAGASRLWNELVKSQDSDIARSALVRLFEKAQAKNDVTAMNEAAIMAEEALREYPAKLKDFWLAAAVASYEKGRDDLAESYFRRIETRWEGNEPRIALYRADIAGKRGERARALSLVEEGLPAAGELRDSYIVQAAYYASNLGDWEKAERYSAELLQAYPESIYVPQAAYFQAFALARKGELRGAIDSLKDAAIYETSVPEIVFLKADLYRKSGALSLADDAFQKYISQNPKDPDARVSYISMLFSRSQFERVAKEVADLDSAIPSRQAMKEEAWAVSRYMLGVSSVATGRWDLAFTAFSAMPRTSYPSLQEAYPAAAFYQAYSLYRLARYPEALAAFDSFLKAYPSHEFAYRAFYLSAWCSIIRKNYPDARERLSAAVKAAVTSEDKARALFLAGKTALLRKDTNDARDAFDSIIRFLTDSSYVLEAYFEHAGILFSEGKTKEAAEEYRDIYVRWPESPRSEEALYRQGEAFIQGKDWKSARESFSSYLKELPKGRFADASLYFLAYATENLAKTLTGQAAADANAEAVSLRERLARDFRDSAYRFNALSEGAALAKRLANYEKAYSLASSLVTDYPEDSKSIRADELLLELSYLRSGLPENVAKLYVVVNRTGGAGSAEGRKAQVELAKYYLTTKEKDFCLHFLNPVIDREAEDPAAAAEAYRVRAEYFSGIAMYVDAAKDLLKTASLSAKGNDDKAESLLRAAEAYAKAGRFDDAKAVVAILEAKFPKSPFLESAKRIKGVQQ